VKLIDTREITPPVDVEPLKRSGDDNRSGVSVFETLPVRVVTRSRRGVGEVQELDSDEKTRVLIHFLKGLPKKISPNNEFVRSLAFNEAHEAALAKKKRIRDNTEEQLQFDLFQVADIGKTAEPVRKRGFFGRRGLRNGR
jgi:hypothetical protein